MSHHAAYDAAPWTRHYPDNLGEIPLTEFRNLAELARDSAAKWSGNIAFTTVVANGMSGSLSYARVEEMSDAFAVYLREVLGLPAGSRIALQMPNCLTYPVAALGVLKAGCVLVNINPLYTEREMQRQLADAGADAIVIMDMFADKLAAIIAETQVKHVVVTSIAQWFPPVVRFILKGILKYWNRVVPRLTIPAHGIDEALALGREKRQQGNVDVREYSAGVNRDSIAALQYTGGTTGISKGAVLTHGNLLTNVAQLRMISKDFFEDGKEIILTALPLYHIFAFTVNFLFCHTYGARNILVPNPRPVQNCQRAIENYGITWISGVNTFYNALLNEEWFNIYPPKTIKVAVAGGAALHETVARRWENVVGTTIAEGYGLTETAPLLSFNPLSGKSMPGSIGIPVPETAIRIVNEHGEPVQPGERGEIAARGPQIMQGYWNRQDETDKSLHDGWFRTGDIGYMNEYGFFHIVDRKKDMILVSGFNVYPNEIEECIAMLEGVHESAVVGAPDETTGEMVCAYIVRRDPALTAEAVREHCRRELAAYKVPKRIEFRDELPKTPIGKVLRKELRDTDAA